MDTHKSSSPGTKPKQLKPTTLVDKMRGNTCRWCYKWVVHVLPDEALDLTLAAKTHCRYTIITGLELVDVLPVTDQTHIYIELYILHNHS